MRIENRTKAFEWYQFQWPWVTEPRFQGHDIVQRQIIRKWYKIELYLQWPTKSYTVCSIERRHFQWPWTTLNLFFKVTPFFDAEYLRNGTTFRRSYNKILIWTYAVLKGVISNDLECVSQIFNDTKHHAVSATAELLVHSSLATPLLNIYA